MQRTDWTPVVLIIASISVTVVIGVLVTTPWIRESFRSPPGPELARHRLAPKLDVWVGEVVPGVRGVLSQVWGEDEADKDHDATLNEELPLPDGTHLAFYHLLLFNTSEEDREVSLGDAALTIRGPDGEAVPLRSLPALVGGPEKVPEALRSVLGVRGTLRKEVVVPAGMMADLIVAFERRVPLASAREVASADGATFVRRPTSRSKLEELVEHPDIQRLEDL